MKWTFNLTKDGYVGDIFRELEDSQEEVHRAMIKALAGRIYDQAVQIELLTKIVEERT